jgi:hypothetical protein
VSGDILGPFQLTSTNTFASASGDPSGERGEGGGGSPSARRTTRRTRKFRAGGGRGHRIILATITVPAVGQTARPSGEETDAFRQKKRLPATTLPTTSDRKSKLPQKDRAPRPQLPPKIPARLQQERHGRLDLRARTGRPSDPRIGGGRERRKVGFWRRNRD